MEIPNTSEEERVRFPCGCSISHVHLGVIQEYLKEDFRDENATLHRYETMLYNFCVFYIYLKPVEFYIYIHVNVFKSTH